MKKILIIILILNCLLSYASNDTCRDIYSDKKTIFKYKSNYDRFLKNVYRDTSKNFIKYQISFVNKSNQPPLVSSIEVNTNIDIKENILFEAIKITYLPRVGSNYEADLLGEEIDFTINPFYGHNNDISIVDIRALGWRINKDDKFVHLVNFSNTRLNNTIIFILIIKNPCKYKTRIIDFYNIYGVDFYCHMSIDSGYNFTGYYPNLPFPSIGLPDSINDFFNNYGTSLSKQNQIINNKILYQGYFVSDINYSNVFLNFREIPKTHMQFRYGYDYSININKVIIEENKVSTEQTLNEIIRSSNNSTHIALVLFALSIIISVFIYLHQRGIWLNNSIMVFIFFLFKHLKLYLKLFFQKLTLVLKKILRINKKLIKSTENKKSEE